MFPQYCFNCFNPYMMDYNSDDTMSRQKQPPTQPGQPQIMQQPPTQPGQSQIMQQPPSFEQAPGSPMDLGVEYTQGYLKTQIGKRVRIFFLIGTNIVQDREGILTDVGISYIILRETGTNVRVLCDIYAIKFVNIFP
ncbi:hypothetical protein HBE96_04720 [Clostridium sp. P21]|uniref:Spore coat protein GerQ n=1 Tax=Clostridium muellerianum TaxID=2716538 RepID=A0A7Y0EEP9_9CLOT|nr:hypothetical protein [Clostridium muellerianum]NMM62003.1 hypothetical protein [Clostridium muellerianum]